MQRAEGKDNSAFYHRADVIINKLDVLQRSYADFLIFKTRHKLVQKRVNFLNTA